MPAPAATLLDRLVAAKNGGRGFIPGRVDIDERPERVELKERFGDLEITDMHYSSKLRESAVLLFYLFTV